MSDAAWLVVSDDTSLLAVAAVLSEAGVGLASVSPEQIVVDDLGEIAVLEVEPSGALGGLQVGEHDGQIRVTHRGFAVLRRVLQPLLTSRWGAGLRVCDGLGHLWVAQELAERLTDPQWTWWDEVADEGR